MELFIRNFLQLLLTALTVLIFGRVLLSWTDPGGRGQLLGFVVSATEPILAPVRRFMPRTGMIDLAPTVVLIVLFMLMRSI